MKIRFLKSFSTGRGFKRAGDVDDWPKAQAEHWVAEGVAELASSPRRDPPVERAEAKPKGEKAKAIHIRRSKPVRRKKAPARKGSKSK